MNNSYIIYKNKLKGEYQKTFERIETYIDALSISSSSKEELMHSIMDSFLSAQEEGKPVEKITGRDVEKFCDEACSAFGFKEHFIAFMENIKFLVYVSFIFSIIGIVPFFDELEKNPSLNYFSYKSGGDMLFGFILAIIFLYFIDLIANKIVKGILIKKRNFTMGYAAAVRLGVVLLAVLIELGLFFGLSIFLSPDVKTLQIIPLWVSQFMITVIFILVNVVTNREKNKNPDIMQVYTDNAMMESIRQSEEEKFIKQNQKLSEKKMKPLTKKQFLEDELKKAEKSKNPLPYIITPIILTAAMGLFVQLFLEGFESFTDFVVFFAAMILITYLIMMLFYNLGKNYSNDLIAWIKHEMENPEIKTENKTKKIKK